MSSSSSERQAAAGATIARPTRRDPGGRPDAVVAGAGIAGLAAAIALRAAGSEVRIVDRVQEPGPAGAGILLQANGLLALDALGLGEAARASGVAVQELPIRSVATNLAYRLDFASALPPRLWPVSIHRADLHRLLVAGCADRGVEVELGLTVVDVERGVRPRLVCLTDSGTDRLDGELVVGADGVHSTVRERTGFRVRRDWIAEASVQGVAPVAVDPSLHGEYLGAGEACGMLPLPRDRTFWFWGGAADLVRGLDGVAFSDWRASVEARFPQLGPVLEHHSGWEGLPRLLHQSVHCERWSSGRVVLIGDAAHAMSPNLGQGANCALCDAVALASSVSANRELEQALERFERDRKPLVERIQRRGSREGRASTRSGPGSTALLNLSLRLARLAPASVRRAEIRLMSGLRGRRGLDLQAAGIEAAGALFADTPLDAPTPARRSSADG